MPIGKVTTYSNTRESNYYIELEQFKLFFSSKTVMQKFAITYKQYVQAEYDKFVNKYNVNDIEITSKITPDFPPSILMTCKGDFLCKEIYPIMKALEKQTVPFQCNFYGTKEKPLWHVFHVDCDMKEAQESNNAMI